MAQAIKVGIFAAVVLAVVGFFILKIEDLRLFQPKGRRVDALFDSVAGLDDKAAVRVAGVRVGKVDGVKLEGRRARVTLLLEQPVALTEGSRAVIASTGLLGDKYVELVPGPSGGPELAADSVLEGETPVSLDQAIARFDKIGANIEQITGSLTGSGGPENTISRLLSNLEQVSAEVRDLIATNREAVSGTVRNFESASGTLARELPRLADRMESVLAEIGGLVADNKGNVAASLENIKHITEELQPAIADLKTISGRLAAGEGTIGKLLTSDEAHNQLVATLDTIKGGVNSLKDTLGAAQRIKLDYAMEGYYLPDRDKSQAGLALDIDTSSDWLYRVGVYDPADLVTRTKVQEVTETLPDGTVQHRRLETLSEEDRLRISALL
ncbi:MAG TPA: MlaD family protein, partial [Thermoanaerobaculia bacterium]|nr:MlaD family protein [Thermoanaerobaculia bacterium]